MRSNDIEGLKKNLGLNQIQRSILVGMLLGDGHLEMQHGARTYRLKVEHSIRQKEYVEWLYEQFKNLIRGPLHAKVKKLNGKEFSSLSFTTYSLGSFRFYAQQFYVGRTKVIPKLISKLLDPLVLAVWFMDDGSFKSDHHRTYIIHTVGYSKKDLELIKTVLEKKFGIEVGLHKQYERWRLYVYSRSADTFSKLISPYVIPSMKYKLGNIMPKE